MSAKITKSSTHGTNDCYTHGKCRCAACRTAHAKANAKRNRKVENNLRELGYRLQWVKSDGIGATILVGTKPDNFNFYGQAPTRLGTKST